MFSGGDAVTGGLLTPADLRSRAWQQVLRGIYADATITLTHRHRCLAVARFVLPDGGVIAGRSAAYLYGARLAGPTDPVEVLVPPTARIRGRDALVVHTGGLSSAEIQPRAALPLTTPIRTCWDLAQWLDPVEAVVHVDALAAARSMDLAQFLRFAKGRQAERGWRRALRVATLADTGAASPPESRLRVRLVLAGVPKPVTQFVIAHNGQFIARVDLAWPDCGVGVEYDGEWHAGTDQFHADRRRLNQLMGAGWIVLHVTARRLREDFDGFVAELRAALRSRRSPQM
jgi:very-short-patch-repair endonuclease